MDLYKRGEYTQALNLTHGIMYVYLCMWVILCAGTIYFQLRINTEVTDETICRLGQETETNDDTKAEELNSQL